MRPQRSSAPRHLGRILLATLVLACAGCAGSPEVTPAEPADLRVAYPDAPVTFDPHLHNENNTFSVLANVYEALTTFDAHMDLGPGLAESWYNLDDLSWRFVLRQGVRFHDGRPLTVTDVVASLNRAIEHPRSIVSAYLGAVDSVAAIDERTVEVLTREPYPLLANRLTFISIVPRDAPEEIERPIGTGPFRFESFEASTLILRSAATGSSGAPPWRTMRFEFEPLTTRRAEAFAKGEVDLALFLDAEAVELLGDSRVDLKRQSGFVSYLGFRVDQPPFSDPRVRHGISLALDRVQAARALRGSVAPIGQLVGRHVNGFVPEIALPKPDRGRARELLTAAGLPPGSRLKLDVVAGRAQRGRVIAQQLTEVGFEIETVEWPGAELYTRLAAGDSTLFMMGYVCSGGDASDLFEAALHSPDADRGWGAANLMRYSNVEFDRLIESAGQTLDMERRRELLARGMSIALEELPLIPLWQDLSTHALRPGLSWQPRLDYRLLGAAVEPGE